MRENAKLNLRSSLLFIICCLVAAAAPLAPKRSDVTEEQNAFPGWPSQFEGHDLTQSALSQREERFAADFPGRVARFSDGRREIIYRWAARETRALHPSADCFKGLGYSIRSLPAHIDQTGRRWGAFEARRGAETITVHERIFDMVDKESWSDVSNWYWRAALGKTAGPWWAVTVAEKQ